jgi:type IV pilus assembly protein PilM
MAAAPKVITVDLGTSTIKFAEFGIGRGGSLMLLHFGVAELGLDPNKTEERAKFITPTLANLFKSNGIKGGEVYLSISGQSVFMRFVKLPPIDPAQVEQVVAFEAQQNVPFPITEVTWDYQMMSSRADGSEAEAVIVAIKKEMLELEVEAVEKTGVRIKQVDIAPFALLNAFRYSEPQTEECSLIIDIGARSTNLVFVEKSSFWIRNIPIAGNQISQSISNEMQEPFASAEMLKKGKGFVSLGGVYADPDDPDTARISKLIRSTMTRLHIDINRSVAFYRTTLGGGAPKRVFLTGGSSQLPYLDLFIADKLNLPVAYFNPLRNVTIGPSVNQALLQQNNCYTSELVGLALRKTGSCPAEVSLDAPSLVARTSKGRKQPYFYAALTVWVLIFVLLGLYYYQQILVADDAMNTLQSRTNNLKRLAPQIGTLVEQQTALEQTLGVAVELGNQRQAWAQVLDTINAKMPDGVWITELYPAKASDTAAASSTERNGGGSRGAGGGGGFRGGGGGAAGSPDEITVLIINGLYQSNDSTEQVSPDRLRDFVDALADTPYFDVNKNNVHDTLTAFTTAGSNSSAFAQQFSMHLKLKVPIRLRP